jgi:predicted transposase
LLNETCKFKLDPTGEQKKILKELFSAYRSMVEECLKSAVSMNITSRERLHESIYEHSCKTPMCRPPLLAAKAINEALKAEVERIVIKC